MTSHKDKLYEQAYEAMLKQIGVQAIDICFYADSVKPYRCVPYLQATTFENRYVPFEIDDKYHRFDFAYIHSLNTSTPICFARWEVAKHVFELLEHTNLYLNTYRWVNGEFERKCVLPKGLSLKILLINNDLLYFNQQDSLGFLPNASKIYI